MVLIVVGWVGFNLLKSKTVRSTADLAAARQFTKSQTVCLDPGHGGSDPGANNQDVYERDINLTVAENVRDQLEQAGYRAFMTRTTNDPTLSNHDRYTFCNNNHATIMVSIHHNYFDDSSVDYDTVLYYKDSDQALAASILDATAPKLGLANDGVTSFEDGVLSESNMPAALSEAFFVTNNDEYNWLTTAGSGRLSDEADGIVTGIENYFAAQTKATAAQSQHAAQNSHE